MCQIKIKKNSGVYPPIIELMSRALATGIQSESTISQSLSCNTLVTGKKNMYTFRHTHTLTNITSGIWASVGMREAAVDKQFIIKLALLKFLIPNSITHCIPNVWSIHININWSPSLFFVESTLEISRQVQWWFGAKQNYWYNLERCPYFTSWRVSWHLSNEIRNEFTWFIFKLHEAFSFKMSSEKNLRWSLSRARLRWRQLVKSCEVARRWGGMISTFSLASTSTEETILNIYVLCLCVASIINQNQKDLFTMIQSYQRFVFW